MISKEVLPHWRSDVNDQYLTIGKRFTPPEDIHSPYYPLKGPYSSRDPEIIFNQFAEMRQSGIDVAVLSWWGQSSKNYSTDTQGISTDSIVSIIMGLAEHDGFIKIAFHLEPYPSRSALSVRDDIKYILEKYGSYTSFYRTRDGLPLFYVYDSYHISTDEWEDILQPDGKNTIRNSPLDAVMIGLWLERQNGDDLKRSGFDGVYTYFASEGFSYGSSVHNWLRICNYCRANEMLCVLSAGPGYNDTKIRPWNHANTMSRRCGVWVINKDDQFGLVSQLRFSFSVLSPVHLRDGSYYREMLEGALAANPHVVRLLQAPSSLAQYCSRMLSLNVTVPLMSLPSCSPSSHLLSMIVRINVLPPKHNLF